MSRSRLRRTVRWQEAGTAGPGEGSSMTTIATQHHHGVPFAAAICLAGGLVGAGIVGVAWHAASHSAAPAEAPAVHAYPAQGYYGRTHHHHPFSGPHGSVEKGQQALGGIDGHAPPA